MAVTFGVTRHTGTYVESVDVEKTIETAVLKNRAGVDSIVHPYNPTKKFNLKVRGEPSTYDVGATDPGITGISGGVTIVESVKDGETNTDFPSADTSGTNYPNATLVA